MNGRTMTTHRNLKGKELDWEIVKNCDHTLPEKVYGR